jgi:hypothetical protein
MVVKTGHFKNRSEITGKFQTVVLERAGEEQLYRLFEK